MMALSKVYQFTLFQAQQDCGCHELYWEASTLALYSNSPVLGGLSVAPLGLSLLVV